MLKYFKKKSYLLLLGLFLIVIFIGIKFIMNKIKIKYLHKTLLDILKKTIPIFDKHNINYWAIGGTLLGSIREEKIIDHDDDIDIAIDYDDIIKLKNNQNNILNDFEEIGLHVAFYISDDKNENMFKIVKKNNNGNYPRSLHRGQSNEIKKNITNFIFIDVFPFRMNDNKYTYAYKDYREEWPNSYFLDGEVFPLKKSKFEDIEINIPNKSVTFLERFFGGCNNNNECWQIPKVTHDHLNEINISLYDILFN